MKTVDARGMQCPLPIIETRKALRECQAGEIIKVLIDNQTSFGNVCKFLIDNNIQFSDNHTGDCWEITITTGGTDLADSQVEGYCTTSPEPARRDSIVVVLSSDKMGSGDDTLGSKLMASFVNILTELDTMPSAVLCYNGGVKLALPESPVAETLSELEKRGVEVILCGTCIDFYQIKGKTVAGKTGDMYRIATHMAAASLVLRP